MSPHRSSPTVLELTTPPFHFAAVGANRIPYAALTHVFSLIEATTKRLEITSLLTSFLLLVIKRSSSKEGAGADSLRQAVYLCINRVQFISLASS